MNWQVFYGDGTTHQGNGQPEMPLCARGVQAIVQDHPDVGVEIVTASDYYVWEGRWRGVDIFGLFDYLLDTGMVLFGRTIRKEEYGEIMRQVAKRKAGWLPHERKG